MLGSSRCCQIGEHRQPAGRFKLPWDVSNSDILVRLPFQTPFYQHMPRSTQILGPKKQVPYPPLRVMGSTGKQSASAGTAR